MKVLLHICCGVCAAGAIDSLLKEGHSVTGFFYNPNIYPEEEYMKRLETASLAAEKFNIPLMSVPYKPDEWISLCEPLKEEPEGGKRCLICYRLRLQQTFSYLNISLSDIFTSTLSISPHKSAEVINKIGREIGGNRFLERNFKKKEGFKIAVQLAKKWNLYHQDYCGCKYSIRPASPPVVG